MPRQKNYINNRDFYDAIVKYYETGKESKYLIACLIELTSRIAKKSFSGYTWVEDMQQDAIISCLKALRTRKFNPETTKNPFSYFTTCVRFSFLKTLKREKRQGEIAEKLIKDKKRPP